MLKQNNQVVEETRDRHESKGGVLAISRRVYRILNSDIFYVESESVDNLYYFVKFKPDVFELCSCPDSWTRHVKCKHLFAIEFAIRMGTLKDIDKLPVEAKRYNGSSTTVTTKSLESDNYDF